jgi:predicted transcriptional regulator
MNPARTLRLARRRAGLTQRALATRTGIAQPTIARIERGKDDPRVSTLGRLLGACDEVLEALPQAGVGVDRTEIRRLLDLSPGDRARTLAEDATVLDRLDRARGATR